MSKSGYLDHSMVMASIKLLNRTNVSDDMLNNIPASETISAAGIYRSIINTVIDALRINIDEVSPSLTVNG